MTHTLDRTARIRSAWQAAWDQGRVEVLDELLSPGYVRRRGPAAAPQDREQFKNSVRAIREAFPDLEIQPTSPPLFRGAHACVPWRALGTHRGDIGQTLPATDRFITIHGLHYLELSDGSIRRARGFFDLYDAATQLGLLPSRGGLGETALLILRGFGVRRKT